MRQHGFDIAVIGGGIIGLTAARALAREHLHIVVIDAGSARPSASNAAAGMLAPSFEDGLGGEALYHLSAKSLRFWPDYAAALEEETGCFVDLQRDGILGVALSDKDADKLHRQHASLRKRGARVEMISPSQARELEPALSGPIRAALFAPGDGQVDPRLVIEALKISLHQLDAEWLNASVTKIIHDGAAWQVETSEGAQIGTANIIIATGAASALAGTRLPSTAIFPVKGEALAVTQATSPLIRRVIRGPGAYICPKADGRLIIGATEITGRDDLDVDADAIETLLQKACEYAPVVKTLLEVDRWAGLRPATADSAPILGPDANMPAGLFYALGHHRNGVLLAPASASALADMIMGRPTASEMANFSPNRFG